MSATEWGTQRRNKNMTKLSESRRKISAIYSLDPHFLEAVAIALLIKLLNQQLSILPFELVFERIKRLNVLSIKLCVFGGIQSLKFVVVAHHDTVPFHFVALRQLPICHCKRFQSDIDIRNMFPFPEWLSCFFQVPCKC